MLCNNNETKNGESSHFHRRLLFTMYITSFTIIIKKTRSQGQVNKRVQYNGSEQANCKCMRTPNHTKSTEWKCEQKIKVAMFWDKQCGSNTFVFAPVEFKQCFYFKYVHIKKLIFVYPLVVTLSITLQREKKIVT